MYLHQIERVKPFIERSHIMGITNTSRMETQVFDRYWEAYYRRTSSEGYRHSGCFAVPADFDDNEDAGNDIRRRERVAQACYEL
jgi:hypothetical protein